ncbi:MAG: DUF5362 family protein [Ginsengibacter sp.]
MSDLDLLHNDLMVTPASHTFLNEAARWGKFLSIVGFILSGLIAIGAFFAPSIYTKLSAFNEMSVGAAGVAATVITIIYLVFAVLLFFPCLFLNKFSVKMKAALTSVNQEYFEESFKNLKSLFKFYGIFTIIILSFYALAFVIAMLTVAMRP